MTGRHRKLSKEKLGCTTILQENLMVNIHDVISCGLLRMVGPRQLVEVLKQNGVPIKNKNFWSEEGRLNLGDFEVDGLKIHYQVCGLFAGDEYIVFPKSTPKKLVDKVLAVLQLTIAEEMIPHHNRDISGFVVTPNELVAGAEGNLTSYRDKELTKANNYISEAKRVLDGEISYFDGLLKNYKRSKTLGEALLNMSLHMITVENFVKSNIKEKTMAYLVESYFDWKTKTTGFEDLHKSFEEKIPSDYECLSTSPQRGWGKLDKRQKQELKHLKKAVDNPKLIEEAVKIGNKLLPKLKKELEDQKE